MRLRLKRSNIHDIIFFIFMCVYSINTTDGSFIQMALSYAYVLCGSILYIKKSKIQPYFIYSCIWIGYLFLSVLWATNRADATAYCTIFIKLALIVFILTNRVKTKDDLIYIIKLLVHSRLFCAIILIVKTPNSEWGTMNIGSAIGMWKNELGICFVIATVFALLLLVTESKHQVLYAIETGIFTLIAFMSGSRNALGMLLIIFIVYSFLKDRSRITTNTIMKRIGMLLLICISIILLYRLVMENEVLYKLIGSRIESALLYASVGQSDESMLERSYYIQQAMQLFRDNPILGAGSNGFVSYLRSVDYDHIAYSHNNFTEILCTLGVVGFLAYYYMPFRMIIKLCPITYSDDLIRKMICLLWLLVVVFLVFGFWMVYYTDIYMNFAFIIPGLTLQLVNSNTIQRSNDR